VLVRPITPDDRDALRAGFERLSDGSRYRRFLSPVARLTDSQLDYLTRIDHHDHEALAAVDDTDDGSIVGVARFVRSDESEAEPAIVVADDWQGRGLGTALLEALAARSREEGIERYRALVLAENQEVLGLLRHVGEVRQHPAGAELEVEVLLDVEPPAGPSLTTVLKAAAEGALTPGRALLQRLSGASRKPSTVEAPLRNLIVVGTDGNAGRAVQRAAELAQALGSDIHLVASQTRLLGDATELEAAVDEVARDVRERGLDVEVHVGRGDPAASLVDVAAEQRARLIVVGAGTRTGAGRFMPAGIGEAVARQAPCDVLVVRD
jgi:nucleotide-binding universal stress UspA family protein/GNAT superfamily N-acetyltransferase